MLDDGPILEKISTFVKVINETSAQKCKIYLLVLWCYNFVSIFWTLKENLKC